MDRRELDRMTLKMLVERFVEEELQDGGRRRGAAEDRASHVPCILRDEIAGLTLAKLTSAAVRGFRDRQSTLHAPSTVVKRLNLLSGMLSHARAEWDIALRENPATAEAVKRPAELQVARSVARLASSITHTSCNLLPSPGLGYPPDEKGAGMHDKQREILRRASAVMTSAKFGRIGGAAVTEYRKVVARLDADRLLGGTAWAGPTATARTPATAAVCRAAWAGRTHLEVASAYRDLQNQTVSVPEAIELLEEWVPLAEACRPAPPSGGCCLVLLTSCSAD